MTVFAPAGAPGSLPLAALIAAMMVEFQAMHRDLNALQDAVSPLVQGCPAVNGPDRPPPTVTARLHVPMGRGPPGALQELDRLTQIAAELSRLCEALATCLSSGGGDCCAATALRAVMMKSLQDRLAGVASVPGNDAPGRGEAEIWV